LEVVEDEVEGRYIGLMLAVQHVVLALAAHVDV
jgi:hypothetical protein